MSEVRLIDANALRNNIEHLYKVYTEEGFDHFYTEVLFAIDNAPTITPEKVLIANVTFDTEKLKELTDDIVERIKNGEIVLQDERPQGKWIYVSRNCWKCPYCQELTNEGKNFCHNCGADMRKPYERPKPHPAAFCDGDCVHCKILDECEKADGGES